MKTEDIVQVFFNEFKGLKPEKKFVIFKLKYQDADDPNELDMWDWEHNCWENTKDRSLINKYIWHPGVYVFWRSNEVIRVGRALDNARKRALFYRNDSKKIKDVHDYIYQDLENTALLLFSVKDEKDKHWGAALEIFFDLHDDINPTKRSKKLG